MNHDWFIYILAIKYLSTNWSIFMKNPQPYTPCILNAEFKNTPQDFVVKEIMDIDFSEEGEHLWLYIQKINTNTAFVAKLLATWANINVCDVGYSGLKDRRAVTYQWFSLRIPKKQLPATAFDDFIQSQALNTDESVVLLQKHWHHKKLNRGTHKSNQFIITLNHILGDKAFIDKQLSIIKEKGVPNYFGHQRFGIHQNNIENSKKFFEKLLQSNKVYKPHKKDMERHSLYISVAKSLIFNRILSKRILLNNWDTPTQGDVFNLDGTGSIFSADIDDAINRRLVLGDIHVASILFGEGKRHSSHIARTIEDEVLACDDLTVFKQGLLKLGSKLSHRPLRLIPKQLTWQWQEDTLILDFYLPSGAFATSLLDAIVANLTQAH